MEQIIKSYMKRTNNENTISTYKIMERNLSRLRKVMDTEIEDFKISDFKDVKEIMEKISKKYSNSTIIQSILAIREFIYSKEGKSSLYEKYSDEMKKLMELRDKKEKKNEMSDTEKANWINYDDLKEKYLQNVEFTIMNADYTKKKSNRELFKEIRDKLMLGLFILIPPTRISNYRQMIVKDKNTFKNSNNLNKNYNYLIYDDENNFELVFNEYKTKKYVGGLKKVLPKTHLISLIIKLFLEVRKVIVHKNSKYLFTCLFNTIEPINQPNFTDIIKKTSKIVVGKILSVNLLRHIYLSDYLTKEKSIEHREQTANFMGQTYTPQMMDKYRRIDVEPKENNVVFN